MKFEGRDDLATLTIPRSGKANPLELHAKAYSDAIKEVLNDLSAAQGSSDVTRICGWAYQQKRLTPQRKSLYSKSILRCKSLTDILVKFHKPACGGRNPRADMLVAKPEYLNEIAEEIDKVSCSLGQQDVARWRDIMKYLFWYRGFCCGMNLARETSGKSKGRFSWMGSLKQDLKGWGSYKFINALNVRYCPYCNSETIFAIDVNKTRVKNGKTGLVPIVSSLDHFFPHAQYPFLGISLYNLVPCCTRCNSSIKEQQPLNFNDHASPYSEDLYSGLEFRASIDNLKNVIACDTPKDFQIKVVGTRYRESPRVVSLMRGIFCLEDVYNELFKSEAYQIVRKIRMFPKTRRRQLLSEIGYSGVDVERAIWGVSTSKKDITKNRHAKLVIDLMKQYGA